MSSNSIGKPSKKKFVLIGIVTTAIVVLASIIYTVFLVNPNSGINSFAECADAGYPIQLSYPEVCTVPGGKSFTNTK